MNQYSMKIKLCDVHIFSDCYNSELYEAERWHNDSRMWTPMTILKNGQHIFIGDIIDVNSCIGKVIKFVKVCYTQLIFTNFVWSIQKGGMLQAIIHVIKFEQVLRMFTITEDATMVSCSLISGLSTLSFDRTMLIKENMDGTFTTLTDNVRLANQHTK